MTPAPLRTQSPAHHLPAAQSQSLIPPLTESQSPPRLTNHRQWPRQSWGSPRSQSPWCQTRCDSRQQSSPRWRAWWTAEARREALPTVPWLRVSSALWTVCYLPLSRHHLPALNCLSACLDLYVCLEIFGCPESYASTIMTMEVIPLTLALTVL